MKNIRMKKNNKKAVSLIVLVITIIVMIILAATIMLSLNNSGIIGKAQQAVDETNLKEIQTLAALKWSEVYMDGNITPEQRSQEVLKRIYDEKLDLTAYEITVTDKGVTVVMKNRDNDGDLDPIEPSNPWVVDTVDKVPIPKGFVASPYGLDEVTGEQAENTKAGGLVIYELKDNETEIPAYETRHTAKTTRNQYVWVPVEDFSKFLRKNLSQANAISNKLGEGQWEVALETTTNMPLPSQESLYITIATAQDGITNTLAEVQAMYESVKTYKGFYIARYEAGLDIENKKISNDGKIIKDVYSQMNKAPYNYVRWTYNNKMDEDTKGAVEVSRSIYPVTAAEWGVVSTLAYGVQWDMTIDWWVKEKAKNGTGDATISSEDNLLNSILYGNYTANEIPNSTFNQGASYSSDDGKTYTEIKSNFSKTSSQSRLFTTGATEETRVNNIYDMAGNLYEWTMEGSSANSRMLRGAYYKSFGDETNVSLRVNVEPNTALSSIGFRPALYIKMLSNQ